ncbi:MAG TPA: hypothetical protein VGG74_07330 [Kofleriaceae bacterium]|jgi:hypothetical protein
MKKLLVVVAIAVIGVAAWRVRSHKSVDTQDGKSVLVDRLWLDHIPSHEREPFNILALFSEHSVGVFQKLTAYTGNYEMFQYGNGGWKYPQTRETDSPTVRIRRCDDNGMDFCMDITGNSRGVHRYYSRKDWVIKSLADEQALAAKLDAAR